MQTRRQRTAAGMASALLGALVAGQACALEQGRFEAGVYTAPGRLFTVKSPLGPDAQLFDTFDRRTGAVTFLGGSGEIYGIVCTPNLDILAGADNDFETDAAILRNWLRDTTLPMFFQHIAPGSTILREEPTEFDGAPAWIALIRLPNASTAMRIDPESGYPMRQDSWRGVVVFSRGDQTYLLMTEATSDVPGAAPEFDLSGPAWNDFILDLSEFYRGMSFELTVPESATKYASRAPHAGT